MSGKEEIKIIPRFGGWSPGLKDGTILLKMKDWSAVEGSCLTEFILEPQNCLCRTRSSVIIVSLCVFLYAGHATSLGQGSYCYILKDRWVC